VIVDATVRSEVTLVASDCFFLLPTFWEEVVAFDWRTIVASVDMASEARAFGDWRIQSSPMRIVVMMEAVDFVLVDVTHFPRRKVVVYPTCSSWVIDSKDNQKVRVWKASICNS